MAGGELLAKHKLKYEKVRWRKMSTKKALATQGKENKQMAKTKIGVRDIIIAVLITAIIAFIAGMGYEAQRSAQVKSAAEALAKQMTTQPKPAAAAEAQPAGK